MRLVIFDKETGKVLTSREQLRTPDCLDERFEREIGLAPGPYANLYLQEVRKKTGLPHLQLVEDSEVPGL